MTIALLGAEDPLGEAVIRLVAERDVEIGEIVPLSLEESDRCVHIAGEEVPLQAIAGVDWSSVDVLILASRAADAQRQGEVARRAGCVVIGGNSAASPVNAVAVAIARVAAAIARHAPPLQALDAMVVMPVSAAGVAGIEELAGQARALFAMDDVEPETFPVQIAFNLIPQVGLPQADGVTDYEAEIVRATRGLLAAPDLPLTVTALWAPVFYGGSIVLHGELGSNLTAEQLRSCLADAGGIVAMDAQLPGGVPCPATDALDSDDVFVSRLRVSAGTRQRFALWLVIDMLRLEAAQIVDRLEKAVDAGTASVLT